MITNWHCDYANDGGTPPTITSSDCMVTASTSDPIATMATTSAGYTGPNLHEVLFMFAVFIFFMSYFVWPKFSIFRLLKLYD